MEKIHETESVTTLVLAASVVGGSSGGGGDSGNGGGGDGGFSKFRASNLINSNAQASGVDAPATSFDAPTPGSNTGVPIGVNLQLGLPEEMRDLADEDIERMGLFSNK